MNIVLRTATSGDTAAIEHLFIEMLQLIYQTEKIDGYESDYLHRFFTDSEDRIIVAECDNTVIGYISVELKREVIPIAHFFTRKKHAQACFFYEICRRRMNLFRDERKMVLLTVE